ncbi:hypothetical protein CEB3_c18610 [Peptococcaceae bacterium CEB3]|nr:hypothetical protein CEB3_c18610 [Peptococcaceae bacterium CEB3]
MAQNYELIPVYFANNGQPEMVFENVKVTPAVFIQDNRGDVADAQKIEAAIKKLPAVHRPLVFVATEFRTSDPTKALKEVAGMGLTPNAMVLAGDPNLYPTTTPTLVYWDAKAGKYQTVTDINQIVHMIPSLLKLGVAKK